MKYYLTLALVLFVYMSLWFVISLIKKRNDVADVAWGLGFVLLAWVSFYLGDASGERALMVCLLVSIWGVRLAWHIYWRNRGKPEDYRYQQLSAFIPSSLSFTRGAAFYDCLAGAFNQ